MIRSNRCLYANSFFDFCSEDNNSILGTIVDSYHGDRLTSTREAWIEEIKILKSLLEPYKVEEGKNIKYEIHRCGKRIDKVIINIIIIREVEKWTLHYLNIL